LYYCKDRVCTAVKDVGYYVNNQSEIYSCSSSDDGKCIKTSANTGGCTATTVGELLKVGTNELSLCLKNEKSIGLEDNAGSYIVNYKNGNIFGITDNKYALVNVKKRTVTLDKTHNTHYIYADKSSNAVLENSDQCPRDGDIESLIIELNCNKSICSENGN